MPKKAAKRRKQKKFNYGLAAGFIILAALLAAGFLWQNNKKPNQTVVSQPTADWKITRNANNHQIEGYASLASTTPGAEIDLSVSCGSGHSFTTNIYRMGYYQGNGALKVEEIGAQGCQAQNIPKPSPQTGLTDLNWPANVHLQIPSSWQPGIYLAKLTNSEGYQNYVPFTVRSPQPQNRYLFVHGLNTDNAYNIWGGNSLYSGHTPDLNINRAVKASLNRPFSQLDGNKDGSGQFLEWEYPMIKFLEKNGYQVDYTTDVDIHEHPDILQHYKAVIITGHDEYWSKQMLGGYYSALANGVNLAVFAANTAYRPVRFEPDPVTGQPDRIMVDYKSVTLDPQSKTDDKSLVTAYSWRAKPLLMPESQLLGIAYRNETDEAGYIENETAEASYALVVSDDKNWMFKGTGLHNGDKIPGIVGYEYEQATKILPHPSNVDIVFHSPVTNIHKGTDYADVGYYTYQAPGGGQVFDAGTMQWSWGLDPSNKLYSPALVKVTENILNRFGS